MEEVGNYKAIMNGSEKTYKEEKEEEEEEEEGMLPGFRFHPTDEELVGFYLKRKVEKKPLRIELIKHIDIYKYDPWDLPKEVRSSEKEWYFFCIRGRKYRNSIRPNRVTGSGFWKATGIDKPIHSLKEPHHCIGLKKSLVYYRGSAGKGTKTDWMMHEFRLPPNPTAISNDTNTNNLQEAEVWTLCRIFKRIPSYKKYTPSLKDTAVAAATATKPYYFATDSNNSKTCSLESNNNNNSKQYLTSIRSISSDSLIHDHHHHHHHQHQQNIVERKPVLLDERSHFFLGQLAHQAPSSTSTVTNNNYEHQNVEDVFANGNWDELRSVVQFAVDPSAIYDCTGF